MNSTIENSELLNSNKRISFSFVFIFLQFILIFLIFHLFEFEKSAGISLFASVILGGFLVHHFSPRNFRPLVFFLQSAWIVFVAFGVFSGGLLLLGTLFMFLVLRSNLSRGLKIAALIIFFLALLPFRVEFFYMPRIQIIVPFLAGFFMFRAVGFLYDRKYYQVKAGFLQEFNFFFMGPNICFPLFPILDFKNYINSAYSGDDIKLYQKGIYRMTEGLINLLLFRLVYHYLYLSPMHVQDTLDLIQFIISSYLLLLRIPGLFLFISGWLCMFGFDMPPAFGRFYFSYNFAEVWRRINIYWRDFVVKNIFNRLFYFELGLSLSFRIFLITTITFLFSAFLHSWQLLWLTGDFSTGFSGIFYWLVMGVLVFISSMREQRSRVHKNFLLQNNEWKAVIQHAFSVLFVFLVAAILYSFWITDDVFGWLFLMSKIKTIAWFDVLVLAFLCLLFVIVFSISHRFLLRYSRLQEFITVLPFLSSFILFVMLTVRIIDPPVLQKVLHSVPNSEDIDRMEKGYYDATAGDVFRTGFNWELKLNRTKAEFFNREDSLHKRREDLLTRELRPSVSVILRGSRYTTNRFGMRDKEYTLNPDPNCPRFAVLGASYTMGYGVNDGESFESLLEDTLTKDRCIEFLNFGVGSYSLIQQVELLETKVPDFQPNGIIYTAHSAEEFRVTRTFVGLVQNGVDLKYPELLSIKERSGMKQYMSYNELYNRAKAFSGELLDWGYHKILYYCQTNNCVPIMIFIQATIDENDKSEWNRLKSKVLGMGFLVLDGSGAYGSHPMKDVQVSGDDHHPNAFGHRLIMRTLYQEWKKNEEKILNYHHGKGTNN